MEASSTTPLLRNPVDNGVSHDSDIREKEVRFANEDAPVTRATLSDMVDRDFYRRERWMDELCEGLFKIRYRQTTIKAEIYYGLVHYVSCLFCLAVIPAQMSQAGYDKRGVFISTAVCSGVGSIICGLFANLPFVIAPPAAVAIFLSVYLQNYQDSVGFENLPKVGSASVMLSGVLLMLMGYRPLGNFISRLIPSGIQAGTAVGIGLVTALAGAVDIDLVVEGRFSVLLRMGVVSPEVIVAFAGVVIICVATHYHMKGAFCMAIISCSIVWGIYSGDWPTGVASLPSPTTCVFTHMRDPHIPVLIADLLFLYILYLNGLIASLSLIANLVRDDGSTPRGRWIFILTGAITTLSGYLTGAPVLISPESAAGIKDGAKTGLSALVCGILFILSVFFSPLFDAIPKSGTSPILLMIGALLFQNTLRIDWTNITKATPAFIVLFFIPFTYSVIQGVLLGYVVYILVGLFTGGLFMDGIWMARVTLPQKWCDKYLPPLDGAPTRNSDDDGHSGECEERVDKNKYGDIVLDECSRHPSTSVATTRTSSKVSSSPSGSMSVPGGAINSSNSAHNSKDLSRANSVQRQQLQADMLMLSAQNSDEMNVLTDPQAQHLSTRRMSVDTLVYSLDEFEEQLSVSKQQQQQQHKQRLSNKSPQTTSSVIAGGGGSSSIEANSSGKGGRSSTFRPRAASLPASAFVNNNNLNRLSEVTEESLSTGRPTDVSDLEEGRPQQYGSLQQRQINDDKDDQ